MLTSEMENKMMRAASGIKVSLDQPNYRRKKERGQYTKKPPIQRGETVSKN
jgi:hypothetical protein